MYVKTLGSLMTGAALCALLATAATAAPRSMNHLPSFGPVHLIAEEVAQEDIGEEEAAEDPGSAEPGADDSDEVTTGIEGQDPREGCDFCRGDEGEEIADDTGTDIPDTVSDDDGMVWAGGNPDFCEACGGVVVDAEPGLEAYSTMNGETREFGTAGAVARSDDRGARGRCDTLASSGSCNDN